ncbi:diacylglycerol kinase [Pseudonocardia sp. CNS-139]|nr:diacylglycerol kinase [Pseudonocardia sp. CNS-139]
MGRRLAAAGALIGLVAALVAVVLATFRNVGLLVLTAVLVLVAVVAAWTALVHRGAVRAIAGVVAGLALLAVVVLLVVAVLQLDGAAVGRIVLVVLLVLASAAAARYALADELDTAPAGRPVGPARHGVLLMNPRSGGGKAARFDLAGEARRRGVDAVPLLPGDDLRVLAEDAVAAGADVLGMAGGDGSQALVADVARRFGLAYVCVPAGTRNHFALDLGLDRDDVVGALDAFGTAVERRIDLAAIGDRIFVNNASLGVYARVVQSDAYRDAKLATAAQMLPDLLGPDAPPFDLRFERPGGEPTTSADMVLVSNGVYRLDSMTGFGTRPRLDGGVLGVVTVSVDRARDLPALVSAEATGRISRFRGYRAWSVPQLVIDSGEPLLDVGVDGEALQLPPPLMFRTLPGALRVRVPVDAPGVAQPAPKLGEAVPALLRVLAGHPARTG